MAVREPAVAGQFYPLEKKQLQEEIERCFSVSGKPGPCRHTNRVFAIVSPHAGYVYSGGVAAYSFKALAEDRKFETAVIIGPNHTGLGAGVSVFTEGEWETPLGNTKVDGKLAKEIAERFSDNNSAHNYEHSAEVQVPFIQHLSKEAKIVPICVLDQELETMVKLGKTLAELLDSKKHVVIASTDFSHYVPYDEAYANDLRAIAAIKKLDEKALYETVAKHGISMCGPGGVAAAIVYAKEKGAKEGELLKYATSGDITGDRGQVVGYGALALRR
jgi:hypothetical protein